jgi:hypothetical protein
MDKNRAKLEGNRLRVLIVQQQDLVFGVTQILQLVCDQLQFGLQSKCF